MKKVGKKQGWKVFLEVVLLIGWGFVSLVGAELLVGLIAGWLVPGKILSLPVVNTVFSLIAYLLAGFLAVFVPARIPKVRNFMKSTRERLGLKGLPTWTDIGLAPIGYIITILITMGLTLILKNFDWYNANEVQNLGYSIYMQGWERGLAFIQLVIIAPIIEELIFRGWLYGNLRVKIPKWVAILLVSGLFGLVHFQWNVGTTVFVMSVISCLLRETTGTIYAGTLLHITNNAIAFYLIYVVGIM